MEHKSILNSEEDKNLSDKEFQTILERWKTKEDPEAADKILEKVEPIINTAITTYAMNKSPILKSHAKKIVLDKIKNYDPKVAKLNTYLMNHLQSLRRLSATESRIAYAPERVMLDSIRYNKSVNALWDQLGREPTSQEIADHSGLSLKRIEKLRKIKPVVSESTITDVSSGDEDKSYDPAVISRDDNSVWLNFVYSSLEPKDQLIMEYLLGLHGKPKLNKSEIAKKFKVSVSAITQRAEKIQKMINMKEDLNIHYI